MSREIEHKGKIYVAEQQFFESCDDCIFMGKGAACEQAPPCHDIIFTDVLEKEDKDGNC
jgi:hypothetical protein